MRITFNRRHVDNARSGDEFLFVPDAESTGGHGVYQHRSGSRIRIINSQGTVWCEYKRVDVVMYRAVFLDQDDTYMAYGIVYSDELWPLPEMPG